MQPQKPERESPLKSRYFLHVQVNLLLPWRLLIISGLGNICGEKISERTPIPVETANTLNCLISIPRLYKLNKYNVILAIRPPFTSSKHFCLYCFIFCVASLSIFYLILIKFVKQQELTIPVCLQMNLNTQWEQIQREEDC